MHMESGSGFVENKHNLLFVRLLAQKIGKFNALTLPTAQCAGGLAQFNITQAHLLQWPQLLYNPFHC